MPTKDVPIVLADGATRQLRYDFTALVALEEAGVSISNLQELLTGPGGNLRAFRDLLWAGLLSAEPGLTRESVARLIEVQRLGEIAETVARAVSESFGTAGKGPGDSKNAETPA